MKALSLRQPWAELVLQGKKAVETRVWNTKFRGTFLIHASGMDVGACSEFGIDPSSLAVGSIVGKAELADVKAYANDRAFLADAGLHLVSRMALARVGWSGRKKYGFVLRNVARLAPKKCKGSLGFWEA